MSSVSGPFFFLGGLILTGILGLLIFKKFKINDVLLMMLVGVLAGPVLRLVDATPFASFLPLAGAIALTMVLFKEGLYMHQKELAKDFFRVVLLSFFLFAATVVLITGAVLFLLPGVGLFQAVVIAVVFSAPGPTVVLPLLSKLSVTSSLKKFLTLEVVITDSFCIIGTSTLIALSTVRNFGVLDAFLQFAFFSAVSLILGIGAGWVWKHVISRYRDSFTYLLTLAFAFLTYGSASYLGSNGVLAVFVFGAYIINSSGLLLLTKITEVMTFHDEFTFLANTFFFVYLGLLFDPASLFRSEFTILAFGIILAIVAARFLAFRLFAVSNRKTESLLAFLCSRGLATSVLSALVVESGVVVLSSFPSVAFVLIFLTNVLATTGACRYEIGQKY